MQAFIGNPNVKNLFSNYLIDLYHIQRRIHLDLGQQLFSPSGTKNGHGAPNVPNVKPVAGQQEAPPNGLARLVLPDASAGRRVQTMNRSAEVPDIQ
jgi:hypothetical protein